MIVRLTNKWLHFENISVWEEEIVAERFSAENPNSRYIDDSAYQGWDGVYRKYSKKHRRLARPFLAELRLLARDRSLAITVKDDRGPSEYQPVPIDQIGPDFLPGITLKQFQVAAARKVCIAECGLIAITTGGGKCVTGEAKILLNGREVSIAEVCSDLAEEEVLDVSKFELFVDSPNGAVKVNRIYKTNERRILRLTLSTGHILGAVPEHRVYSDSGWKRLDELKHGDRIQVYATNSSRIGPGRLYNAQAGEANLQRAKGSTAKCGIYQLIVSTVRDSVRNETQVIHQEGEKIRCSLLPEMFSIEGSQRQDEDSSEVLRGNLGQVQADDNDQESGERCCDQSKDRQDLSDTLWPCRPGCTTRCGQIASSTKVQGNQRAQWYNTEFTECHRQVQKDDDEQERGRASRNQETQDCDLAQKPCNRGFDKRVVLQGSQSPYETYHYEVWAASLPEPIGACIHQIVRGIESSIGVGARTNDSLCKFLVFIGLPVDDKLGSSDSRDQIKILVRDEKGRDITKEICGGEICKTKVDEISLARARQAQRDGFCVSNNWAEVKSVACYGLDNCYDLQVASQSHAYWTNGILSHNTEIMAAICKAMNCPTVIIAEQIIVIDQIRERLSLRDVCEEPGLFYAGRMPSDELIVIGSIQSLVLPKKKPEKPTKDKYKNTKSSTAEQKFKQAQKRYQASLKGYKSRVKKARALHKLIGQCEMILVDECDLAVGKTYQSLFRYWFKGRRRYGFTGTPYDYYKPVQRLVLNEHLGSVIYQQSRTQVEDSGLIVPLEYYMLVFGETGNRKDATAYDIALDEWLIYNEDYHRLIANICARYPEDGTLILVDRHDLGHALNDLIPDSQFVYGETPKKQRPDMLKAFEERRKKVLIGGKNVRRGLDLSGGCENLILATGGKLVSEFEQRLGRARRQNERGRARVFDFLFLGNKYLYAHSRNRLKAAIAMGYKTTVVFRDGSIDGEKFVHSRFRKPRFAANRCAG